MHNAEIQFLPPFSTLSDDIDTAFLSKNDLLKLKNSVSGVGLNSYVSVTSSPSQAQGTELHCCSCRDVPVHFLAQESTRFRTLFCVFRLVLTFAASKPVILKLCLDPTLNSPWENTSSPSSLKVSPYLRIFGFQGNEKVFHSLSVVSVC